MDKSPASAKIQLVRTHNPEEAMVSIRIGSALLHPGKTPSAATQLTEPEKDALLDFSRPGGKSGRVAWNSLVKEIKTAHGNQYPKDWHAMIIQGKLFEDEKLPPPRCDDLSDVDPGVAAFMEQLRANENLPDWAK